MVAFLFLRDLCCVGVLRVFFVGFRYMKLSIHATPRDSGDKHTPDTHILHSADKVESECACGDEWPHRPCNLEVQEQNKHAVSSLDGVR